MNDHERGFLEFLDPPTNRRVATLLATGAKRRKEVRALLDHAVRLDPRFARHLTGREALAGAVETLLRERDAPPSCYVLAADGRLDGREMPLTEALAAVIGRGNGAFLSCVPGRLGFYEYESAGSSYLLTK